MEERNEREGISCKRRRKKKRVEKDEGEPLRQQGWYKEKEKKRDRRRHKGIRVETLRTWAKGMCGGEE